MHSESDVQARQVPTDIRAVLVQVSVAGLQLFAPHRSPSLSGVHATQVPVPSSHTGVPARWLQSGSDEQPPQVLELVSHAAATGSLQSALSSQATQVPSTQALVVPVQVLASAPRHSTHSFVSTLQISGNVQPPQGAGGASVPPSTSMVGVGEHAARSATRSARQI